MVTQDEPAMLLPIAYVTTSAALAIGADIDLEENELCQLYTWPEVSDAESPPCLGFLVDESGNLMLCIKETDSERSAAAAVFLAIQFLSPHEATVDLHGVELDREMIEYYLSRLNPAYQGSRMVH